MLQGEMSLINFFCLFSLTKQKKEKKNIAPSSRKTNSLVLTGKSYKKKIIYAMRSIC